MFRIVMAIFKGRGGQRPGGNRRPVFNRSERGREEHTRLLAKMAADWYWETDATLVIQYMSDWYFERTGVDTRDHIGKSIFEILPEGFEQNTEARRRLHEIQKKPEPFRDMDLRIPVPEIPDFVCRINGAPVFSSDGTFVGYRGTGRDVTEQIAAEQFHLLFQAMVERAGQGLGVAEKSGKLIYANPALLNMLGLPRDTEPGSINMVDQISADCREVLEKEIRPALRRGRNWTGELDFSLSDGRSIPVIHNIFSIPVAGQLKHVLGGVYTDISEQRAILNQLDAARTAADEANRTKLGAARKAVEKANRAKSEFLSNMSHELRTPLNAILGFAQLLQMDRQASLTPTDVEYVGHILTSGYHLLALIGDLLDLSKIESGRVDLCLEPISLDAILAEVHPLVLNLAEKRRIKVVRLAHNGTSPIVRADYTRLKQILLNLLSNAVKYNCDGGTITIEIEAGPDEVRVSVIDTGIGIAAEDMDELFTPFSRLGAEYGAQEGTGIGLVITKRLVSLMGGEIGVDSKKDVGSRFWITLPVPAEGGAAARGEQGFRGDVTRSTALPVAEAPQAKTVVYIEDNPAHIRLIESFFAKIGDCDLITAHTGELGVAAAVRAVPDLVLLDINLPGINGFEVLRQLRAEPTTAACPVFALSANAMKSDIEQGLQAGFAEYLTKPINLHELGLTIRRYWAA